ncbi:MAG: OmpA family protein [Desulfuromonadales bacterium]|nr:OmpA family protein [Desulfuromonadales bacterium]
MKSLAKILSLSLMTVFCLTGTSLAGQQAEAFSVSPLLGYHVFEGDQNVDDYANFGLALGYNITKRWAVEFEARYTPTEVDLPGLKDSDLNIWTLGINALYHFNPDGRFVPYLLAGFGGMTFDSDDFQDDEDFMLNWGLGAKYFLSDTTALRLDARHIIDLHSDRRYDQLSSSDDTDHNLIASVGLYWQFGGVTPAPAPLDSDGDGIPDSRDKCPDTPLGTPVDAVGCPPVEKAPAPTPAPLPVVDGDDDGDGVPNSRDKCPGTPKGVIVDEHGCEIKFTLQLEFDFDKADIRPQYHGKLQQAADFIGKYPEAKFLLAGHTDSIGTDAYNSKLSERRATAVKNYLVSNFGIKAERLYPRGYGESQPTADNSTEEGRQHNRRVEVICCVVIPEM